MLDRQLHDNLVITIQGDSYRLCKKRRVGLFYSRDVNDKAEPIA